MILTNENLIKRNWHGNTTCCFCDNDESIQHLFFECPLAKIVWRLVHIIFGLALSKNVTNLFVNWLACINKKDVKQIRICVCAIIWALWNARMIMSLTNWKLHPFYMLFQWQSTGSIRGPISNKWSSGMSWILGATVWRRMHRIYSTKIRLAAW
jgi:hypothetical protein